MTFPPIDPKSADRFTLPRKSLEELLFPVRNSPKEAA